MKSLFRIFIALNLWILSGSLLADVGTHIVETKISSNGQNYEYTGFIDYWDEDDKRPNLCFKKNFCMLDVAIKEIESNLHYTPRGISLNDISDLETIGEIGKLFKKKYPLPYKISGGSNTQYTPGNHCIAISFYLNGNVNHIGEITNFCKPAPPANLTCSITGNNNIEITPATSDEAKSGFKGGYIKIAIKCNLDATLYAYAYGEAGNRTVTLKPDGSLYAFLYFTSGEQGYEGKKINVKANKETLSSLNAYLQADSDVEPGPFHGSGVLILTTP
ncbi:hypothetical protein AAGR08_19015 [Pantoea sp. BRR-3P]|uniref:MrpH family fimbial adhesin n=1 Tax=Pantoea sp. BRR-3P TaxID=3141541 RepID=UPI0031F4A970